jgi:outer membrane receptor protein involved in Fe transport
MGSRTFKSVLAGGVCALALNSAAFAQAEQAKTFDVPAGDLAPALDAYIKQSGEQLIYRVADVRGMKTSGVRGALTSDEALQQLLAGTSLQVKRDPSGLIAVASAADPQSGSAAGDGADSGTVQALIVTAQKREENIQDVPIAISAFTQEDLTRSQVAGGPDLMTQVPNFTFTKTNFSSYSIQIRGIGTQAISATVDPAVAVAFNNTPFVRNHFFEQEFYDLERVEVLRGPQGTLYGRNATAGVVNVISAKPKNHFEAKLSGDLSNYSSTRLEGMVNIPLVEDKAALRIAGAWTKRDGFVKNILTGKQTDGRDLWSTRVTLGLTPTDRFTANLIYEHFEENDDRLRSGKQLCHKDPGPATVGGVPVPNDNGSALGVGDNYYSQGCRPASLYSPDSFETPNGHALAYYGPLGQIGSPVYTNLDPYVSSTQSRNLREIETHIEPNYEASSDVAELQLRFDLTSGLSLSSETGFSRDYIFSYEDFNRFDTTPGVFVFDPERPDIVSADGVFCDPQVGCSNRLAAADVATAKSQQFSQEFRLSSNFDGPLNFSAGANFLRYDTEDKYYVFINSLTASQISWSGVPWVPGQSDNSVCFESNVGGQQFDQRGYTWSDPNKIYYIYAGAMCAYIDPNNVHNLNDEGRNYFLSKNPYHLLSYSVFGEAYYNLTSDIKLTAGFRWTVDKKTAPQIPSWLLAAESFGTPTRKVIEQEWREPTGRVAIDWRPILPFTDQTLLYASYVRGYKAGGANPPPPIVVLPPACPPNCNDPDRNYSDAYRSLTHPESFEPEFVDAFEIGAKNVLLDGRLTLNLGAFYYDYKGYQISEIVDRSAVNLNFDAKVWGAEIEADWRPLQNLRLGFKGGYENTRMADGSSAIDLMDRTAGHTDWVLMKPLPPLPSNCIVPVWLASLNGSLRNNLCYGYLVNVDPITSHPYIPNPSPDYPGFDPASAPNNGEGFAKDLSGNELPNAPRYTATITADYTLPLPHDWLVTLHTDVYYQSEAWTRVFNTPGYDKLKAYNNINVAAIFSNEEAGWNVMAYVKNVLDRDSITGAFLNSDDTGLTTNVFLTEPRLYGIRVTKQWTGGAPLGSLFGGHDPQGHDPFRVELSGYYGLFSRGHEFVAPDAVSLFPAEHPYPLGIQDELDWGAAGGIKFTWQPRKDGWFASAGVRYGHAGGNVEDHGTTWDDIPGGYYSSRFVPGLRYDPKAHGWLNYAEATASNSESHAIADFMVGKDVGLGAWPARASSNASVGLRYAHFNSGGHVLMNGRPDLAFPSDFIWLTGGHMHRFHAHVNAAREFEGAGIAGEWDASIKLVGDAERMGRLDMEVGLGAGVLFGKQATAVKGQLRGGYTVEIGTQYFPSYGYPGRQHVIDAYDTQLDIRRSKRTTVPSVNANLGLSYTVGGVKVSGGYQWERYFNVIDGGVMQRKTYDRTIDGPYFKIAVGFGG